MKTVRTENIDFIQAMKRYDVYNSKFEYDTPIKLIALDLDGTTMNTENQLPAENKKILESAIAEGVNVVVASGRCYNSLPKEVTGIRGVQYAISSNGAQVRDLRTGEVLHSDCADPRAVHMLHDIVKENGYDIEVFVDGMAYMEKERWEDVRDGRITYRRRDYILNTRQPVEDILGFMMQHDDKIENVNIYFEDLSVKPAIRKTLEPLEEFATVTTSFDTNWEMGGLTTSKAEGLRVLSEILGVEKEEMMAFGDSPNDIPMIEAAGIGVSQCLRQSRGLGALLKEGVPAAVSPQAQTPPGDEGAADQAQTDADQRRQDTDAAQGKDRAQQAAQGRHRRQVAVAHGGHGDQRKPERVSKAVDAGARGAALRRQQQEQQPQIHAQGGQDDSGRFFHLPAPFFSPARRSFGSVSTLSISIC